MQIKVESRLIANTTIVMLPVRRVNESPDRPEAWKQVDTFVCYPKQNMYTVLELQEVLDGLALGNNPTRIIKFSETEHFLYFGSLRFEETDDGENNSHKGEPAKRRPVKKEIVVQLFPSKAVVDLIYLDSLGLPTDHSAISTKRIEKSILYHLKRESSSFFRYRDLLLNGTLRAVPDDRISEHKEQPIPEGPPLTEQKTRHGLYVTLSVIAFVLLSLAIYTGKLVPPFSR